MRLSRIRLAGFKSFVDPTTLSVPSNLMGIVGPNGCGKSNIIDAVRWVLGESSAKHLRGDSMADVIFNGSSARKPVGTASIELVFDNSEGSIGGQYASYSEISVKRSVTRDGTSTYYLNNTKCRRKDITHIFLGTGLGPRSYAIIEQGMISRLIEARPEEMRVYIEEAAGISRFKDRRRETENRMRHTRENLERLDDLREEVEKHLRHLNRQAATARRYKKLKTEERRVAAELLALKLRELEDRSKAEERLVRERETALEAARAKQRAVEASIEKAREKHGARSDAFGEVQARYYKVGAEIARLEQDIKHGRELRLRQERDREEARVGFAEISGHIGRDEKELSTIEAALEELMPRLEHARADEHASGEGLQKAEREMQRWRESWEAFNRETSDAQQSSHVEQARIEHLEQELQRSKFARARIDAELGELNVNALKAEIEPLLRAREELSRRLEQTEGHLERTRRELERSRDEENSLDRELDGKRKMLQELAGRLASLEALQRASSGESAAAGQAWLRERGLEDQPRLAQELAVEPRWRAAVETVLGDTLDAVCVARIEDHAGHLGQLDGASVTLVETRDARGETAAGNLDRFVRGPAAVLERLARVRTAESLQQALEMRSHLGDAESVITSDGVWLARDWVSVRRAAGHARGALEREQEIAVLRERIAGLEREVRELEARQDSARECLAELEARREDDQRESNRLHQRRADMTAGIDARRTRVDQQNVRSGELAKEAEEADDFIAERERRLTAARERLNAAQSVLEGLSRKRTQLDRERAELGARLDEVRARAFADRSAAQELALQVESRRSTRESMQSGLERMRGQLASLQTRVADLDDQLRQGEAPLAGMQERLNALLQSSVGVKEELAGARSLVEQVEEELRRLEQERSAREQEAGDVRDRLDQVRLTAREVKVRREALLEQFEATGFELEAVARELEEAATIEAWTERVEALAAKISRLGPINLAAIEEFKQESERKEYLDAQHADLTEALTTLENAIRRIDRETRSRFKDTFEKVDLGFKELFPQLFGGGHAYLELTGDDLLSAGVTVMARPPGKRNSNIHLLSGGEKALAAVALVFAIFRLNPSPFCMLDEVDAPLDDANVERYCNMVRGMSENIQFVFITHNKITMEMARQLVGVTMAEPGVSRLVAVDVDEAVQMAAV